MAITLIQGDPVGTGRSGAAAVNFTQFVDYSPMLQTNDMIRFARLYINTPGASPGAGTQNGENAQWLDPDTRLPAEIPPGTGEIMFFWSWSRMRPSNPGFGRYVIRHNLPAEYALILSNDPSEVRREPGRIVFDIGHPVGNWYIRIQGPIGPMPANWYIEVVKESNESLLDDASLSSARRVFTPEYLSKLKNLAPSQIRFMNALSVNADVTTIDIEDLTPDTARWHRGRMPLSLVVALCNEVGAACWFNIWSKASNALIQHCAEYLRDNLAASLQVLPELGNENWNSDMRQTKYTRFVGMQRFATQGPGTVSVTEGSKAVVGVGTDFTAHFGAGLSRYIAIDGFAYEINTSNITSTSMSLLWDEAETTSTDAAYYYGSGYDSKDEEGYLLLATNCMQIFDAAFAATGQSDRLVKVLASQLANPGRSQKLLNPTYWVGAPDYVDPTTLFDALAINLYFGSKLLTPTETRNAVISLYNAGDTDGWRNLFNDILFDRHPTLSVSRNFNQVRSNLRETRNHTEAAGLRLIAYEGGSHVVHTPPVKSGDTEIIAAAHDWVASETAREVFEHWRDLHVRYLDGPVMQYRFGGTWDHVGHFALYPESTYPEYPRSEIIVAEKNQEAWWVPTHPPRWANIPAQTLAPGSTFDLTDWCSKNALSFAGQTHSGATLADGILTVGPSASGPQDYRFTASNAAGSSEVTVRIEVG